MKNKIVQLIEKEINWCLDNPATNLSKDFQKGFVAGLKQAKYLATTKLKELYRYKGKMKKYNRYQREMELVDKIMPELMELADICLANMSSMTINVNGGHFEYVADKPKYNPIDFATRIKEMIDELEDRIKEA